MGTLIGFIKNKHVVIGVLIVLVFALCIARIDHYYFGYDERATISCAYGFHFGLELPAQYVTSDFFNSFNTIKGVVQATILDNGNVIAYNLLLHFWVKLVGFSKPLLHLPSILFFVFSIPLFYSILTKVTDNKKIICISLLLFSFQPFFIFMARQVRGYTFSLFLSLAATLLLLVLLESGNVRWKRALQFILYSFSVALLPLTHYMFGVIAFAHLLFILFRAFKTSDYFVMLPFSIAYFFSLLVFVSWLFIGGWEAYTTVLINQLKSWQDHPAGFIGITWYNFFSYLSNLMCFSVGAIWQFLGLRIREYALLCIPISGLLFLGIKQFDIKNSYKWLFLLIPISLLTSDLVLSFRSGILISFYPKYNIILMPIVLIFFSAGIVIAFKKYTSIVYGVFIAILLSYFWIYSKLVYQDKFHIAGATNIEKRKPSPYPKIQDLVNEFAQVGDTLIFPAWEKASFTNHQMLSIPLVQYVNNKDDDLIYLKNGNRTQLIFDFSKDWARYNYQWN